MKTRNLLLCTIFILCALKARAQAPAGYYQDAADASGYHLKSILNRIVSRDVISWNYGNLPAFYELTDRDLYYENDSSMLDIYAENPEGPDPYNYWYSDSSLIAGASAEGEGWNREHIYSQSFFNSNYPMYSDLHFVVPADARVNQQRSNFPFGIVGDHPTFTSLNGTKRGPADMPGYTSTVAEPIDEFKGDIARMMMYIAVRYEHLLPYFQYTNIRNPLDSLSEKAFKSWYIDMLLQWHHSDPVSQKEIDRNNAVHQLQGNRNPFVDHPEFAQSIWGALPNSTAVPEQPYQLDVVARGARFIHLSWPSVQDIEVLGFEVFLDGDRMGTTADNEFVLHHLTPDTDHEIKVRSYSHAYVKSPFTSAISVRTLDMDTFSPDLFISKFIVGSEKNKAVELSNNTGHTVDLRDYYLNIRQENANTGSLYWSANKIQLEGRLPHGRTLVVMNPDAILPCLPADSADILSNAAPMQFDGKFAFELGFRNSNIDRLGSAFDTTDYAVEKSLYRKAIYNYPSGSFDTAQWEVFPSDHCDGLGNVADSSVSVRKLLLPARDRFELYPNPNNTGVVHVKGEGLEAVKTLRIINMDGSTVAEMEHPFAAQSHFELPQQAMGLVIVLIDGVSHVLIVQ